MTTPPPLLWTGVTPSHHPTDKMISGGKDTVPDNRPSRRSRQLEFIFVGRRASDDVRAIDVEALGDGVCAQGGSTSRGKRNVGTIYNVSIADWDG